MGPAPGTLLGLAILFVVGQLIRLQVVTQRAEIEVSQLIGATASDVRRRFLYHGVLQGFLAGVLAGACHQNIAGNVAISKEMLVRDVLKSRHHFCLFAQDLLCLLRGRPGKNS